MFKNYHKSVFVVLYVTSDGVSVVGVYDDYRDADDKRQEEPEKFIVTIAPHYPAPIMEP